MHAIHGMRYTEYSILSEYYSLYSILSEYYSLYSILRVHSQCNGFTNPVGSQHFALAKIVSILKSEIGEFRQ